MHKFIKILFSRISIIILLLILQVLAIIASLFLINEYFIYFSVLLRILNIFTVIHIANRNSNPSYKLAWLVLTLIFPLFGGIFYLFITVQMHTKYYFFRLNSLESKIKHIHTQDKNVLSSISLKFPERESIVKYTNNTAGANACFCSGAQYFPTGEELFNSILCELEKAKNYIFIEFFIIKEGIMWDTILKILKKKAAEGVDVRVMYDGMGSLALLPADYPSTLASYGIKCCIFSPLTPFLSALQNNRDHRKILVIDGKVAYTGGINLSDEYINADSPYGYWKDMSVMVKDKAAFSFTGMFLNLWWQNSETFENIDDFKPIFYPASNDDGFVMPYSDTPQDSRKTGKYIYLDIINKAKKYIYITTPYVIPDEEMLSALKNAALSGVDVRIICPSVADHWYSGAVSHSYYNQLLDSGIKIYEYLPGFIHGKTFCSDDCIAVVGSINLDYRSLYLQFECAAWFLGSSVVDSVKKDFDETLTKCKMVSAPSYTETNILKKLLYAFLRLFAPLM